MKPTLCLVLLCYCSGSLTEARSRVLSTGLLNSRLLADVARHATPIPNVHVARE